MKFKNLGEKSVIIEAGQPLSFSHDTQFGPCFKWKDKESGSFKFKDRDGAGNVLDYSMVSSLDNAIFDPETRIFFWSPKGKKIGNTVTVDFDVTAGNQNYRTQVMITINKGTFIPTPSRHQHAKALTRTLMDKRINSNLTIGIYNSWGEGRSTFLDLIETEMLKYNIKKDDLVQSQINQVHVVRFNASEYNEQEKIWFSLLKQLFNKFKEERGFTAKKQYWKHIILREFKEQWSVLLLATLLATLLTFFIYFIIWVFNINIVTDSEFVAASLLGLSSIATFFIYKVAIPIFKKTNTLFSNSTYDELKTKVKYPNYESRLGTREEVKNSLNDLIKIWIKDSNDRIVVMVDHIDRCSEESIVQLFESLDLFKSNQEYESINFIIPLNLESVCLALASKNLYAIDVENPNRTDKVTFGERILESYVTFPYTMPPITHYEDIIRGLLASGDGSWREEHKDALDEDAFLYDDEDIEVLEDLIQKINMDYLPLKPMEVKKILNLLILSKEEWKIRKELKRDLKYGKYKNFSLLDFRREFISWFFLEYFFPSEAARIVNYLSCHKEEFLDKKFVDLKTELYPRPGKKNFSAYNLFIFLDTIKLDEIGQEYIQVSHEILKRIILATKEK
ncbi:MAG: P-loop NTPase fold protein [Alkalibacterium sp.]|uniref:P-loop NTPase fold protein n=1 Tax=Alkalibacterium sp. TaxID=1872447 RepID=UPI003970DD73